MFSHAAPSDPSARRLKALETQNFLIKAALIVLLALILWRGYSAVPPQAPEAAKPEPATTVSPSLVAPPMEPGPEAAAPADATTEEPTPAAPETAAAAKTLSAEEIYRTAQTLIEAAYRDPRYTGVFSETWAKRCGGASPSGKFAFPVRFDGELAGPTKQVDGLWDYQLWGSGVRDAASPQAPDCWYMILWNYDPQSRTASIESLFIGGKEIVHDWRPYGKHRVTVPVAQ